MITQVQGSSSMRRESFAPKDRYSLNPHAVYLIRIDGLTRQFKTKQGEFTHAFPATVITFENPNKLQNGDASAPEPVTVFKGAMHDKLLASFMNSPEGEKEACFKLVEKVGKKGYSYYIPADVTLRDMQAAAEFAEDGDCFGPQYEGPFDVKDLHSYIDMDGGGFLTINFDKAPGQKPKKAEEPVKKEEADPSLDDLLDSL